MRSLVETSVRRRVTVSMAAIALAAFGLVAYQRLPLELFPKISYPSLTVQTEFADAAPQEVENLVTRPIEEAVGVLKGLQNVHSVSRAGVSEVTLEFSWNVDMNSLFMEVRERIDQIVLPEGTEHPVVLRYDPAMDPIIRAALYGEGDLMEMRILAERKLQPAFEALAGVAAAKIRGGLEEEIQIHLDQEKLAALGVSVERIKQVVASSNVNLPGGLLRGSSTQLLIRATNEFRSIDEIRNLVIKQQGGSVVRLGDVAEVRRGAKERTEITRVNGKECVEIDFYKEGDANTVTVSRIVHQALAKWGGKLPPGLSLAVLFDQSRFIRRSISEVRQSAVLGGILAILVILLFLRDPRSTLIIATSIPLSVLATFVLMYRLDVTLNIMSLGGLTLGIGMLVDNAIVVLESIYRHRSLGKGLAPAAVEGTLEVGPAVVASTLTTVAVFLPIVFVEGIAGQLFGDQAVTVTVSLLASLAVAVTLIPMLSALGSPGSGGARVRRPWGRGEAETPEAPVSCASVCRPGSWGKTETPGGRSTPGAPAGGAASRAEAEEPGPTPPTRPPGPVVGRGGGAGAGKAPGPGAPITAAASREGEATPGAISRLYDGLLRRALDHRRLTVLAAFLVFTLAMLALRWVGKELLPPLREGEFTFEVKMPEGTSLAATDRVTRQMERITAREEQVERYFSLVGARMSSGGIVTRREGENLGQLDVVLANRSDEALEARVADRLRERFASIPDLQAKFTRPAYFTFRTPVEVVLFGEDMEELRRYSLRLAEAVSRLPGVVDVRSSLEAGSPEIQVIFDRAKLARLGLDMAVLSQTLRDRVMGAVPTRFKEADRQVDILVRNRPLDSASLDRVRHLVLPGPSGRPIRLVSVADVRMARGPAEIHRIQQQRAAIVSANLSGRSLGSVARDVEKLLQRDKPPPGVTAELSGQNREMQVSFASLRFALALALFLVYLVMAATFESFLHPFIVLFSVPLAAIGVVLGLVVTGTPVSVIVLIGTVMLVGIVVNNAIVLIDAINRLRRQGLDKREAVVRAGHIRLRPILMTTATTVLGILPMALGWGEGAELRSPLGITVAFGLALSTILTLVVIPSIYMMVPSRVRAESPQPPASRARVRLEEGGA